MSVTPEQIAAYEAEQKKVFDAVVELIDSPDWKESKKEPEITFFTRSDGSSKFSQVKSEVSIPATIEEVKAVLDIVAPVDSNTPKDKRDGCEERYLTNPVNAEDPSQGVFMYVALETPTRIVSGRDFLVFRKRYEYKGGYVYIHSSIVNDDLKAPVKKYVRGNMFFEADIAYPDPANEGTIKMIFMTHADPCGSIPAWVYNAVATDQGYFAKQVKDEVMKRKQ